MGSGVIGAQLVGNAGLAPPICSALEQGVAAPVGQDVPVVGVPIHGRRSWCSLLAPYSAHRPSLWRRRSVNSSPMATDSDRRANFSGQVRVICSRLVRPRRLCQCPSGRARSRTEYLCSHQRGHGRFSGAATARTSTGAMDAVHSVTPGVQGREHVSMQATSESGFEAEQGGAEPRTESGRQSRRSGPRSLDPSGREKSNGA